MALSNDNYQVQSQLDAASLINLITDLNTFITWMGENNLLNTDDIPDTIIWDYLLMNHPDSEARKLSIALTQLEVPGE